MENKYEAILAEIKILENKIHEKILEQEKQYKYIVKKGKVFFEKETAALHKKFSKSLFYYVIGTDFLIALSAPVIYSMIIPFLLLDLFLLFYQTVCFPIYGIPKVIREEYIIFDRHFLKYLNLAEKINCEYCSYANGLLSYATEIAARTEQYWCPIKHAGKTPKPHTRYHLFFDYGDAESYTTKLNDIRKHFEDLKEK